MTNLNTVYFSFTAVLLSMSLVFGSNTYRDSNKVYSEDKDITSSCSLPTQQCQATYNDLELLLETSLEDCRGDILGPCVNSNPGCGRIGDFEYLFTYNYSFLPISTNANSPLVNFNVDVLQPFLQDMSDALNSFQVQNGSNAYPCRFRAEVLSFSGCNQKSAGRNPSITIKLIFTDLRGGC